MQRKIETILKKHNVYSLDLEMELLKYFEKCFEDERWNSVQEDGKPCEEEKVLVWLDNCNTNLIPQICRLKRGQWFHECSGFNFPCKNSDWWTTYPPPPKLIGIFQP